jgi:poly(3-hydroxybutyrate) depolymerase
VYPQGLGATPGWSLAASSEDVALFDALVDQIENELCVDRTRIYTWGFSLGGYFTHVLACVRGDIIDGSSPVSAGMPLSSLDCVGPVPQFIAHGAADTVVSAGQGRAARDVWLNVNGCSETTVPHETEPECVRYEDCDSGAPVVWCELAGVGHGVHQDMGMEAPAIDFLESL